MERKMSMIMANKKMKKMKKMEKKKKKLKKKKLEGRRTHLI